MLRRSIIVAITITIITLGFVTGKSLQQVPSGTWELARDLLDARSGASSALLHNGKVLVTGGTGADELPLASAELFNMGGVFVSAAPMAVPTPSKCSSCANTATPPA